MEKKDFIESGLLESYVLGLSTQSEKEYIKQRISNEPEISSYLIDVESGVNKYFDGTRVQPPQELREIIQLRSNKLDGGKEKHAFNRTSAAEAEKKNQYLDIEVNDTYIKVHKYWRPAFISVFVLSKIFLIAGLYYYFKSTNLQDEIVRLKTEIQLTK